MSQDMSQSGAVAAPDLRVASRQRAFVVPRQVVTLQFDLEANETVAPDPFVQRFGQAVSNVIVRGGFGDSVFDSTRWDAPKGIAGYRALAATNSRVKWSYSKIII